MNFDTTFAVTVHTNYTIKNSYPLIEYYRGGVNVNSKDELVFKHKTAWKDLKRASIEEYSGEYLAFLKEGLTERKVVNYLVEYLRDRGFLSLDELEEKPEKLSGVTGVYNSRSGKTLVALRLAEDFENGFRFVGAHADAPRLDLKPLPVVEKQGLVLLKTHYYGGVKKYQWLNIPLALVGVVVKSNGDVVEISIGTEPGDPVFVISDLLPHLDRRKGDINDVFKGKDLNALAASIPIDLDKDSKESVKLHFLKLLNNKYGLTEEDFISAELQLVPAIEPREIGLDRSMIAGYGHDDRVCSFAAITALADSKELRKNACVLIFDKEEIGSDGLTGAKGSFWINTLVRVARLLKASDPVMTVNLALEKSYMLSGDVSAAINPMFADVHDVENAPRLGYGIVLMKYTGRGGKYGTSDASAEFVAKVRKILNENEIHWQTAILGEVDQGGGGTIAKFFAEKGIEVIDAGPAVLGMHSPF
ncbi:MAG: hypothetical protein PWQ07_1356, partial [Kosmotoga sp.]|nr:hypothetical protein [Kosmotoga sp.]